MESPDVLLLFNDEIAEIENGTRGHRGKRRILCEQFVKILRDGQRLFGWLSDLEVCAAERTQDQIHVYWVSRGSQGA